MQSHPSGDLPRRDPELIQHATDILTCLDTDDFAAIFAEFCEAVPEVGETHISCDHPQPIVIMGIDLNDSRNDISALSEPETIEGTPLEMRPYKPEDLAEYDVIGMVQSNPNLDSPALVQGALVEQLSTQYHLLTMFPAPPSTEPSNPFDNSPVFGSDFEGAVDELFDDLFRSIEHPHAPFFGTHPSRNPLRDYSEEEVDHLEVRSDSVQCRHCGASYGYDDLPEALKCCPGDGESTPLDEKDPESDQ